MSNFAGMAVLALESRRGKEMATLIATYGGRPVVAPAMREVPLESNTAAKEFIDHLVHGQFDAAIFLTGVGTRHLAEIAEAIGARGEFVAALKRVKVVARGPKPAAALRDLGIAPDISVPEPNTWRELLTALDDALQARGMRVAVQEYGAVPAELVQGLEQRGAIVTRVPVYRWALPDDVEPLRAAVRTTAAGEIRVAMFTTSVQIVHLFQVAAEMGMEEALRSGLKRCVIASIGPTTSEELERRGLRADLEASHPKMGILVKEASEHCGELLGTKES